MLRSTTAAALLVAVAGCTNAPTQVPYSAPKKPVTTATPVAAQAEPARTPAASADKGSADARFKAALQLMKDHQPEEAQAAFLSLSQDFPEFSGPLTSLGILYAQGKQRDQAIASFARAVAANPKNAVALNWLGSLYRESGNFRGAEDAYRKALANKPDYSSAHLNLGILYDVSLRRPQDALNEYREYQRLTNSADLMVGVWIKELESSATRTASAGDLP